MLSPFPTFSPPALLMTPGASKSPLQSLHLLSIAVMCDVYASHVERGPHFLPAPRLVLLLAPPSARLAPHFKVRTLRRPFCFAQSVVGNSTSASCLMCYAYPVASQIRRTAQLLSLSATPVLHLSSSILLLFRCHGEDIVRMETGLHQVYIRCTSGVHQV